MRYFAIAPQLSLWDAVLGHIQARGPILRADVLRRFNRDGDAMVRGVLRDLVSTGLVFRTGQGDHTAFRAATHEEQGVSSSASDEASALEEQLTRLVVGGRIAREGSASHAVYRSERVFIPYGAPEGWEAGVLDHYQAMITAVCAKLRQGRTHAEQGEVIGGSTYHLDVWEGHPLEREAVGFPANVRRQAADECSPDTRDKQGEVWLEEDDAHGCPTLVFHPEVCCNCDYAEDQLEACNAGEPCSAGLAQQAAGSNEVTWPAVTCMMEALSSSAPGRYVHERVSSLDREAFGTRHTFIVDVGGEITYARVLYSMADGVNPVEIHEPALRCQPAAVSYFSDCMAAIAADPASEDSFLCAFGDEAATSPSQLEWLADCVEAEVSCN